MRDLTPVRLTGGGTQLVLVDGNGVEYAVPISRIHQVLGNARGRVEARAESATGTTSAAPTPGTRSEKVEQTMESALRPRDIQTRIRSGESPDDVAAVAGTSVERVMVFAAPVLAERAHVARSAQSSSVRRASAEPASTVRTLGPAAATRLRDEGVDPESVDWDAWRRDDGRWTLVAQYHHDGEPRRATFSYDQPGHFVAADDDEGRWLVGDGHFPSREEKQQATRRRLTPVPRYDEELPLGDDALELVRGEQSPTRQHPHAPDPDEVRGDADWIAPERSGAGGGVLPVADTAMPTEEPGVEEPVEPPVEEPLGEPVEEPAQEDDAASRPETDGSVDGPPVRGRPPRPAAEPTLADDADDADDQPRRAMRKGRGRASVPSWDEIMFGGGRGD